MRVTSHTHSPIATSQHRRNRLLLPIGMRLSFAFLVIILLTGLIGFLSIQQFSTLAATTTELNTRDLPEVILLGRLRTLLFNEGDTTQNLVANYVPDKQNTLSAATPTSTTSHPDTTDQQHNQAMISALVATTKEINTLRANLLMFEPPDGPGVNLNDTKLVQGFNNNIMHSNALTAQIQAYLKHNQVAQAQNIEEKQLYPLLQKTLTTSSTFRALEQQETATTATHVQEESSQAIRLIQIFTALGLLLSILLAVIITRSLTRPLSTLLLATEAISAGDLEVAPRIVRHDEIGRLATAFDKMRQNLRSTIATLAQERHQTQAVIDASADGVILVDAKHTILQFNPAAERLSGWSRQEALGRPCGEIFNCDGCSFKEAEEQGRLCLLDAILNPEAEQSSTEMQIRQRNGQLCWLAVSCAPVPQDELTAQPRLVVGMHDISQLKAVEQLKSDFVAMVSHELRAPLTTVIGSVEILGSLDPTADMESYHEVLSILDQQTQRLRQVVEEVLQLTRFDAGRLQVNLQPLSLAQFLRDVLERTRVSWVGDDRKLFLRVPHEDVLIWADHDLLEIVIRNLLDNARKYTPAASPIEVEVETLPATGHVQVRVIDHGPGIPPDQLEHIFNRFSRGTQPSYNWTRGYGLGLYIVRELLRAHNGEVWVENRKEGACFVLSLWSVKEGSHEETLDDGVRIVDGYNNSHDRR